ncbi:MAG: acyl-CoA/acyl-ACP dehydrogenase [Polyangiaceae bacterium]|nr:acyl-CoA/acyl-ACP dehydrogenase [Polyangiaceae bacterium]
MRLDLDEDTTSMQEAVRAFATERVRPRARAWEEAGEIDPLALDEGWQLGFAAMGVPASLGGAGADDALPSALLGAVVLEELAYADLGFALACFSPLHVTVPTVLFGDPELKQAVLPKLVGDKLPAATGAWIEPTRTYDPWTMSARSEPVPGGLGIQGDKTLVPRADAAELTVVMARSGAVGQGALVPFLVEGRNAGGARRGRCDVIAPRAVATFDLSLGGATAKPITHDGGRAHARLAERALVASAAAAVGVARAATDYAAAYAKDRRAFGRAIAQNQSIAFMLAEAATDAEAARWMTWKAAWKIDRASHDGARAEASRAARFAAQTAFRSADACVQILGGHGVIRDHLAELFFRNARTLATTVGWFLV